MIRTILFTTTAILGLLGSSVDVLAQNPSGTSPAATRWQQAIRILLTVEANKFILARGERELADSIAHLPEHERAAARDYLEQMIEKGFRVNTGGARCVFADTERDRRTSLFEKLKAAPWATWDGNSLNRLLTALTENPANYSSEALLHDDFVTHCQKNVASVPAELVGKILAGYSDAKFFHALCFAHRVHASESARWQTAFESRYGNKASPAALWQAFNHLESGIWANLASQREAYQRLLGDELFARKPLPDWTSLEISSVLNLAAASTHDLTEWQFELASALHSQGNAAGLKMLFELCRAHSDKPATYDKLAPLFEKDQQPFFLYLHDPVYNGQGVLSLLNATPANWSRSLASLAGYLTIENEPKWDGALYPLLKTYYRQLAAQDRGKFSENVISPIYQRYSDSKVDKQNSIRSSLLAEAVSRQCFLDVEAQHALLRWFRSNLAWQEVIFLGSTKSPNYRFTADATIAVEKRWLASDRSMETAKNCVDELALWGDWMLKGMLDHPDELNLDVDDVDAALTRLLSEVRDLKRSFGLSKEELHLEKLFDKLNTELSNAVDELKRKDRTAGSNRMTTKRIVRSLRLSLIVSALLEDESQLQTILTVIERDLFDLQKNTAFRVLRPEDLDFTLETFSLLDIELMKCLEEIAASARREGKPELAKMSRDFAQDYHHQIQLGLVTTNEFLAKLHLSDPGPEPYLRLLGVTPNDWLTPFSDQEAEASFKLLTSNLAKARYLNGEEAIVSLLSAYRKRLGLRLWEDPTACGLNENVNLMVLMRLLRDETPPSFADCATRSDRTAWSKPALLPVIDCFINHFASSEADLLLKQVLYSPGNPPSSKATDRYSCWKFADFTERLLRAQEMVSFPVLLNGKPVDASAHVDALLQSALTDRDVAIPSLGVRGEEDSASRSIDGSRRARLIKTLDGLSEAALATQRAEYAILLPNDARNIANPEELKEHDEQRSDAFKQLSGAIAAEPSIEEETLTDALIAALRLQYSQRDHAPKISASQLVEDYKNRLSLSGRQRVQLEILAQMEKQNEDSLHVGCEQHAESPDITCDQCRASLNAALEKRVADLTDIRMLCMEETGIRFEGTPEKKHEIIAQLSRSIQRLQNASEIIKKIDANTVKAAYRLLMLVKRSYDVIPEHWTGADIKAQVTAPDDPLAVSLRGLERLSAAMYCEILPFHGDFDVSAICKNPDAMVVFCLLDTELKEAMMRSVPLTAALEKSDARIRAPIGTPQTAELILVHSIVQPLLALGVWENGNTSQADGRRLIEFIAQGKSYEESFFDRDLAYLISSEFRLDPRKLFEEAFRSIDMAAEVGRQLEAVNWDGDAFLHEAWFGDLRAALRRAAGPPREQFNLDRFIRRAARIPDDARYDNEDSPEVRKCAKTFQKELRDWLRPEKGQNATMRKLLASASSVRTLIALEEGICRRLALQIQGDHSAADEGETVEVVDESIRTFYVDFCSKVLFERHENNRATYPDAVVRKLTREFYGPVEEDASKEYREKFATMFGPFSLARWGSTDTNDTYNVNGFASLYQAAKNSDETTRKFFEDSSYALIDYASNLYWHAGRDSPDTEEPENQPSVLAEHRVSYPWRLTADGRPYIVGDLPENALTAKRLHTEATQANVQWRAECAELYRDIPFLFRFFGGATARKQRGGQL